MIDIVTRYLWPDLQARMERSAELTAGCPVTFIKKPGNYIEPPTKDINSLALSGRNPYIVFTHDDVEFISEGWGNKLAETFAERGWDVIGAVGCKKYDGGLTFAAGYPHCVGKYVANIDGDFRVKIFGPESEAEVKAVDGMFIAVRRDYFAKQQFDEALDFYVENDYCLRAPKVGVMDILLAHHKPPELRGVPVWPIGHNCEVDGSKMFHAKHGLEPKEEQDRRCASVSVDLFKSKKQGDIFREFVSKYKMGEHNG